MLFGATRNFVGSERLDTRGDSRAGLSRPRRAQDPDQTLDSNIRNLCVEFKFELCFSSLAVTNNTRMPASTKKAEIIIKR